MNDLLQQIDQLFAEEPLPLDQSGRLKRVAEILADFDPGLLFLADHRGNLIAVLDNTHGEETADLPALAVELSSLLEKRAFHSYRDKREISSVLVFGQRLTGADSAILGGVLRSPEGSQQQLSRLQPALKACGTFAYEALIADAEISHLATRIRHLTAEQDTIKMAHRTSVATVIDEREARIREQRDYVVHLEEEVEKRSAALREAMGRAEDANRSKSEFLANMSHEIRTPMTAILGFAEMLLEPGLSPEEQTAAIQTIQRNGNYLLEVINDILDLSKIEAAKMVVEQVPCSPAQVVVDVMALLRVRAEAKKLALDAEYVSPFPETVQTDPTRLRQILINVVGNALKFTASGSVRLIARLATADDHDPMLQFDIVDTGIGMSRKEAGRLFQPFSQADSSTSRRFGGTGLGLALARRLANMLGGDVAVVETAPGVGTRVRVTISAGSLDGVRMVSDPAELTQLSVEVAPPPPDIGKPLRGCHVLLAEDGPDNQRLISHVLRKHGAEVTVVENGQQAVQRALDAEEQDNAFHVILMDMQMPMMDGYEATQVLRSKGYAGPIIALTAHAMVGDRNKCLAVGCDAYATKPVNRQQLIETILAHYPVRSETSPPEPLTETGCEASESAATA